MYEIRIELVEVDKPGGEVQGTPIAAKRSKTSKSKDQEFVLWNKLSEEMDVFDYE